MELTTPSFPQKIANKVKQFAAVAAGLAIAHRCLQRPEFFTNSYGLIVDYLAEFFREMRKRSFSDAIDKYFKLGNNLNQRDVIVVRKTVSGLIKLLYPHGVFNKEQVKECLHYALQVHCRIKEQLRKLARWSSMMCILAISTTIRCRSTSLLCQSRAVEL